MSAEKFTISSRVVYTLKSNGNPDQHFEGLQALSDHADELLGAFIDRLHSNHTGNFIKDKLRDHEYITKNADTLQTILALRDEIAYTRDQLENQDHEDNSHYCDRCGSSN